MYLFIMDQSQIKNYLPDFLSSAKSDIQTINKLLGSIFDLTAVAELRRLTHSLKGKSYFLGFRQTGDLAKLIENIFASILDNRLSVSDSNVPEIKKATDCLEQSVDSIEKSGQEINLQDQIKLLTQFLTKANL